MAFHGTPAEYAAAAEAVRTGNATQEQKDANAKMSKQARAGNTSVQNAQDAYKG